MNSSWYYMSPVGMYAYLPCGSYNNYFGYPYYGVNFGYMYGGLPYYYPPPNLVVPIGGGGPTTVVPKPLPHHQSPVVTADHTVAVASNGGLMKVPAFTSVLKTKPTYMTVSRATYTANIQPASLKSSGSSRIEANRFMVATSLPASHAGVSGHSSGAAYRVEASYGAGGSSSHYSGGSSYVGGGYSGGSASHVSAVASSSVSTTASHK
jgi:hypothetical protein